MLPQPRLTVRGTSDYLTARAANPRTGLISPSVYGGTPDVEPYQRPAQESSLPALYEEGYRREKQSWGVAYFEDSSPTPPSHDMTARKSRPHIMRPSAFEARRDAAYPILPIITRSDHSSSREKALGATGILSSPKLSLPPLVPAKISMERSIFSRPPRSPKQMAKAKTTQQSTVGIPQENHNISPLMKPATWREVPKRKPVGANSVFIPNTCSFSATLVNKSKVEDTRGDEQTPELKRCVWWALRAVFLAYLLFCAWRTSQLVVEAMTVIFFPVKMVLNIVKWTVES